ncbi:MAG: diacylglycerol kinase family protein [Acidimicrobiales bacterium]
MSTVHLLIAPDAGRGRASGARAEVLATIRAAGHTPVDLTGSTAAASAAAAADAVAAGASRLIVVGGDGLVHLAVQAVAGTTTTLGVVPVGTGNDFARGLATIPDDPVEATRVALGEPQPLDLIHSDAGWVASVATAGFSGDVNARANRLRFPKGPSRYTVATVLELPTLRVRPVRLTIDGVVHDFDAALLAIANTGWFGGGMHIAPEAGPDDGLLDLTVVADVGRLELLRFFRLVFTGRHLTHPKVHALRGRRVDIDAAGLDLWGDGEPIGTAPATLEVAPGALQIAR